MRSTILYANFNNHSTKERKKEHNIDKNFLLDMPGPLQPVPGSQALSCSEDGACTHVQLCTGNLRSATLPPQCVGWSDRSVEAVVLWDLTLAVEGWADTQPPAALGKTYPLQFLIRPGLQVSVVVTW